MQRISVELSQSGGSFRVGEKNRFESQKPSGESRREIRAEEDLNVLRRSSPGMGGGVPSVGSGRVCDYIASQRLSRREDSRELISVPLRFDRIAPC